MTTPFYYMREALLRSLEAAGGNRLTLPVQPETFTMLEELAARLQQPVRELAVELLAEALRLRCRETDENTTHWEALSRRERQVAALACLGCTNMEIALRLHVSLETVKTHMSNILRKFGLKGRGQLAWTLKRWDFSEFDLPAPE